MLPEENQVISDFKLLKKEYIAEIDSTVLHFEHQKTKTQLVAIKNNDTNIFFSVTFRTLPKNSTGVAHILEHCVLSGSVKYPVKGLFYELYKCSLTTILTAGNSADKTYYQIASRNLKEYYNIMDVILDSTLNPLLKEETFLEEGWHYELHDDQNNTSYKGVVYNEMKGALSNPIYQLERDAWATLYPETTYANIAGGIPKNITELTYAELKQFHVDYYHPSNAMIYLYGNASLEEELKLINENFLSKFEYKKVDPSIRNGNNITKFTTKAVTYNVGTDLDLTNKTYFALCTDICTADNLEIVLTMDIIADLLFNSEFSPLKQEIMASGIAKDISGWVNNLYFAHLIVLLTGSDTCKQEQFVTIYRNALQNIITEGFNKEHITTVINNLKFKNSEMSIDTRRSQNFMYWIANASSYNGDIFSSLKVNELITSVQEKALNSRHLEGIIETYLLNNQKVALVSMIPDPDKNKKAEAEEKTSLIAYEKSLSKTARSELISNCNRLLVYQKQENTSENLKKLPRLSLTDLERKVDFKEPYVHFADDTKILATELNTNNIIYLSVGFNLKNIPIDLLPYIELFGALLKETGTTKRSYIQLDKEIQNYLGGLEIKSQVHTNFNDPTDILPILWIEAKAFSCNIDNLLEIISDICNNLDLNNLGRIKEVVHRFCSSLEKSVQTDGHLLPVTRIQSYLSSYGQYKENLTGLSAYQQIKIFAKNYDQNCETFLTQMKMIKEMLITRNNMIINITAEKHSIDDFINKSKEFTYCFSSISHSPVKKDFPDTIKNEAFINQEQLVYDGLGANIYKYGLKYSGRLEVLKLFLTKEYFFNKVRLQGGAYAIRVFFNPCTGDLIFRSYRDPNVKETYEAYLGSAKAVAEIEMSEEQFNNLKLGAYAEFNKLQNAYNKGITSRDNYLSGMKPEHFNKTIAEILDTTIEDLRAMAPALEKFTQSAYRSIIGNSSKIKANKELFNELIQL